MRIKHKHVKPHKAADKRCVQIVLLLVALLCLLVPSSVFALPANDDCVYAAADDQQTPDVNKNESELPSVEATMPTDQLAEIPDRCTLIDDVYPVAITSAAALPQGAYLEVQEVAVSTAQALLGKPAAEILLAYDIKIMVPGDPEAKEYQPTSDNPVTVTITPPEVPGAPVEVVHLAEDKTTGAITPQTVSAVTATDSGVVQFIAESFSTYVITLNDVNNCTVTFDYDASALDVQYCSTTDGEYLKLSGNVSVTFGTALYFKITSLQTGRTVDSVMRDGNTLMTADGTGVYTLSEITANTTVTIAARITFDLSQSNVTIGATYTGKDSSGNAVTGTHYATNKYCVTQSDPATATVNGINLAGSNITIDLTLAGISSTRGAVGEPTGSINIPADESNVKNVIIRLSGSNTVNSILYYTHAGQQNESIAHSASTLKITSAAGDGSSEGSLTVDAVNRAAASGIGGAGANPTVTGLTIAGGTITVITPADAGCSAIGGGSDGYTELDITGGTVTAENYGYAAAIGAGQAVAGSLGAAAVNISGGTVAAVNHGVNDNGYKYGAAIGGGSSAGTLPGSNGTVTVSGGTVNAAAGAGWNAVGGGNSQSGNGGTGTITIQGGTVEVVTGTLGTDNNGDIIAGGSIGGGSSAAGAGGTAAVNISGGKVLAAADGLIGGNSVSGTGGILTAVITGGTVTATRISGGYSGADSSCNDAEVSITAASVNIADRSNITSVTGPAPDNTGVAAVLFSNVINISQLASFAGGSAGYVAVTSAELADGNTYNLQNVQTDAEGKLYVWLPTGYTVKSLLINDQKYFLGGALEPSADIMYDSLAVGSVLRAVLNNGTAVGYQWQRSPAAGPETWTAIEGTPGTDAVYTVIENDVNQKIRVCITTSTDTVLESTTVTITSDNTPQTQISYTTLEQPSTLTAVLLNYSGSETMTYEWQRYESNEWSAIAANGTGQTYTTVSDDIGKYLRVVITVAGTAYTSAAVAILAPAISVAVPVEAVVTIDAAGTSTASAGSISNSSDRPVYVREIALTWNAGAADFFYDYTQVAATMALGSGENSNSFVLSGASPAPVAPTAAQGMISPATDGNPGTLSIAWSFNLGSGNYIKKAVAAGEQTQVAAITYTISYEAPAEPETPAAQ